MPSINDLIIEVIEKEVSQIDELKLTIIVSMFRMISKVCCLKFFIIKKYALNHLILSFLFVKIFNSILISGYTRRKHKLVKRIY